MTDPVIQTPRGSIIVGENGKAELVWNTNFSPFWKRKYSTAQKFVDSEVIRLSEPYIPLLTGSLIKSGILGTVLGSGEVSWIVPYARYQYYLKRKTLSETGPLRGSFWFHRMKEVHASTIIAGAKKIMG